MPIPAGTPIGPSGPLHAGGRRHDNHPPWSPTIPRTAATPPVRPPSPAASSRASRRRRRRALGTPAWPAGRPASSAAAARTRPGPGPPPTAPPTIRDLGGVACVRACSAVDRAARRRSSPQGPRPVPMAPVAVPNRLVPKCHRLMGTRRTRPDGRGGHQTGGHRRGGHRRGGHQTGPDSRAPDDGTGWVDTALDADRRPTPWLASWQCRLRRRHPTLDAGWRLRPGRCRLGEQQTWTAQQQGLRGHHALRTGLTTATTGSCSVASPAKPRLGALLPSDECRVESRAGRWRPSVYAEVPRAGLVLALGWGAAAGRVVARLVQPRWSGRSMSLVTRHRVGTTKPPSLIRARRPQPASQAFSGPLPMPLTVAGGVVAWS